MKIRTLEELEDRLEEDIAWRKKEILSLKLLIESDDLNRKILLRAGIALLCAHFEGFIKSASNFYVVYISYRKIKCEEIINSLLAIKLKDDFINFKGTEKYSVYARLLNKFESMKDKPFYIKYIVKNSVISTQSNPTSEVLEEILKTIGISSDIFNTKKQYIDYSLLSNRNKIVHGERLELKYDDFNVLFRIIMELIDNYKDLIIQSAEKEAFLKNNIEVEYA